jgi:hypothetical protein
LRPLRRTSHTVDSASSVVALSTLKRLVRQGDTFLPHVCMRKFITSSEG